MFILSNRLKLLAQRVKLLTVGLWHGTLYFFFFLQKKLQCQKRFQLYFIMHFPKEPQIHVAIIKMKHLELPG